MSKDSRYCTRCQKHKPPRAFSGGGSICIKCRHEQRKEVRRNRKAERHSKALVKQINPLSEKKETTKNNSSNTNNDISIFNNDAFGELRVVTRDGEPWFVAKDVCDALGLNNITEAVRGLDDDEKADFRNAVLSSNGVIQNRMQVIVSEAGLYSLILRSRKPEAKVFKRWVTHEVLPNIRKQGAYVRANEGDTEVEILARGMMAAKSALDRLESKVTELVPRAEKYDKYIDIGKNESVGTLAKHARDLGIDVGVDELYRVFRYKRILCAGKGVNWNQPYADSVRAGLMSTKPVPPSKQDTWRCTPVVTPKGMEYFLPRLRDWVKDYREYKSWGGRI